MAPCMFLVDNDIGNAVTPLCFMNVVICIDEFRGLCYCYSKFVSVLDERGAGEK